MFDLKNEVANFLYRKETSYLFKLECIWYFWFNLSKSEQFLPRIFYAKLSYNKYTIQFILFGKLFNKEKIAVMFAFYRLYKSQNQKYSSNKFVERQ